MQHDQLFLDKLADLRTRTGAVKAYDVLGSAGIIRHLILDSTPLVTLANKPHRLSFIYEVHAESPPNPPPMFWAALEGVDPGNYLRPQRTLKLEREAFLNHPVMSIGRRYVSVREVIQHVVKFDGAVHTLRTKMPEDQELEEWSRKRLPAGMRSTVLAMRGISKVVVRALEPLEAAIVASR